jgi:hypothetical protein
VEVAKEHPGELEIHLQQARLKVLMVEITGPKTVWVHPEAAVELVKLVQTLPQVQVVKVAMVPYHLSLVHL